MPASIASLDSTIASDDSWDLEEEEDRIAQEEWEASLEELQKLVSLVMLPFFGKWLGRRWSHWAFARYVKLGLGKSFFFGLPALGSATGRR